MQLRNSFYVILTEVRVHERLTTWVEELSSFYDLGLSHMLAARQGFETYSFSTPCRHFTSWSRKMPGKVFESRNAFLPKSCVLSGSEKRKNIPEDAFSTRCPTGIRTPVFGARNQRPTTRRSGNDRVSFYVPDRQWLDVVLLSSERVSRESTLSHDRASTERKLC